MCHSLTDIQCADAEIKRGKNEEEEDRNQGMKYNGLPYSIR